MDKITHYNFDLIQNVGFLPHKKKKAVKVAKGGKSLLVLVIRKDLMEKVLTAFDIGLKR